MSGVSIATGVSSLDVLNPTTAAAVVGAAENIGYPKKYASGALSNFVSPAGIRVEISYASGRIQNTTPVYPPWMYMDANGPTNFMLQSNIRGLGFGVDSAIHCISTQDRKFYRYSGGAWSGPLSSAIDATAGIFSLMYMDSRGYLFAAWKNPSQALYRSTDGGATWAAVINSSTLPRPDDYIGTMTEADNGSLYATGYNSVDAAGTAVNKVWKSVDGGATWQNITPNLSFQYQRHIHNIVWDVFRKCLWISGGDSNNQYIQVSTDYGQTWSSWTASFQCTAITMDADYLYYGSDLAGDHGIYRARGKTVAEILASVPRRVAKITDVPGTDGTEFAWWADRDAQGNVFFPYTKGARAVLLASSDQGMSWSDVLNTQVPGSTNLGSEFVLVSKYKSGWDSYYYSMMNALRYCTRWRVYKSGIAYAVGNLTGDDDFGNGIDVARKTIPEHGVKPNAVVTLTENYEENASLGLPGLLLDSNGKTFGAAVSGTIAISETFEGAPSLTTVTATGGTVDQAATANPYAGAKHARCVTAASAGSMAMVNKISGVPGVSGDTVWLSGYFYLASATITSATYIAQFNASTGLYIDNTASGGGLCVQTAVDSKIFRQHLDDYVAFPLGQYVKVKMSVYLHATKGEIRVWQDGRRVLHVKGINTLNTYAGTVRWGVSSGQVLTMDVDNVKASLNVDPDLPAAYVLNGRGQLLLREYERSEY